MIDLHLDPSGVIWLRPVPPDRLAGDDPGPADGLEAWSYDLRSGRFRIDTILGFPATFDAAGRGVRVTTDDEGVTRLVPLAKLPR